MIIAYDFQEIKYPRKRTTEAQRTRRDEEERGLLYEIFGYFLIWKSLIFLQLLQKGALGFSQFDIRICVLDFLYCVVIRRASVNQVRSQYRSRSSPPTGAMKDRALQALVKLALEPEWEARFEPNSYGFRAGRSCHDAIEA
ncbi:hypothetical protein LC653_39115, partial [Nostoc sp. CHAB 5784]|nr:hypothetical protein [Nostoc mirabile CHAB5784]